MNTLLFTLFCLLISFCPTIWGAFVWTRYPLSGKGLPKDCGFRKPLLDTYENDKPQGRIMGGKKSGRGNILNSVVIFFVLK